jgi:guanosine-3',5'-bis(diphosphate) 3'-pyrophosphohydrolase
MNFSAEYISMVLGATRFAADKHKSQRVKGAEASPYVNHLIEMGELLWRVGEVRDRDCIVAALLNDTLEDTDTTPEELEELFGRRVRLLVEEVTDDKSLPPERRKQLQVICAATLSSTAKQLRLADKSLNVAQVAFAPAVEWSLERRCEYLRWSELVVSGLRDCNDKLEANFDAVLHRAWERLKSEERCGNTHSLTQRKSAG